MKKTKILSIITLIFAFVLISTGYLMIFIDEYRVDAEEKKSYTSLIKTSFMSYKSNLEIISSEIKSMDIFYVKYYEDIKNNYVKNINILNELDTRIKSIETTAKIFLYECQNGKYNENDIDHKCSVIEYNYESIVNAYISLIEKYNDKFLSYNVWSNDKNDHLELFFSKYYNKYKDINLDGIYSGIIE